MPVNVFSFEKSAVDYSDNPKTTIEEHGFAIVVNHGCTGIQLVL